MADNDGSIWPIGLCYFTAMLTLGVSLGLRDRANKYRLALGDIKDQGGAYSVADLRHLKDQSIDGCAGLDGRRYHLVSGCIVRDKFDRDDSDSKRSKTLYKRLGKDREDRAKLLKAQTYQSLEGYYPGQSINLIKQVCDKDCLLIDEQDPMGPNVLAIDKKVVEKVEMIFGQKSKRNFDLTANMELVKFAALEGTSLTLLGLVKYNAGTEKFEMTELFNVLTGGLQEASRVVQGQIDSLNFGAKVFLIICGFTLGIGGLLHYSKYKADLARYQREQEALQPPVVAPQVELRRLPTQAERGTPECFSCMDKIANVVFAPCNHMWACSDCVNRLRKLDNNACPLCRREVDYDRNMIFQKATA